jgi:hypothetical protein
MAMFHMLSYNIIKVYSLIADNLFNMTASTTEAMARPALRMVNRTNMQ